MAEARCDRCRRLTLPDWKGDFCTGHSIYSWDYGRTWRWASNDSVVPVDVLDAFPAINYNRAKQIQEREVEVSSFLAAYRKNPPKHTAEDLYEMRAAFGVGTVVVNVITGQRTQL